MIDGRKQHWEQMYTSKSAQEVSWYQHAPRQSLDLIARTGIALNAAMIDVGSGASTLVDHLLDLGFEDISLLDISASAHAIVRARLGERADSIDWIETDITTFVPPKTYMLWHDRAVFHFLTEPADRAAYIRTLGSAMMPGGHVIMAAFAIGGPTRCSGLETVQYDAARLKAELGPNFVLHEQSDELHQKPAGGEQLFSFFRLQYQP